MFNFVWHLYLQVYITRWRARMLITLDRSMYVTIKHYTEQVILEQICHKEQGTARWCISSWVLHYRALPYVQLATGSWSSQIDIGLLLPTHINLLLKSILCLLLFLYASVPISNSHVHWWALLRSNIDDLYLLTLCTCVYTCTWADVMCIKVEGAWDTN